MKKYDLASIGMGIIIILLLIWLLKMLLGR